MAEEIFGKDLDQKKEETPKEDPNAKILETIDTLKTGLETINTRLDEFDNKLTEISVTPTPEQQEEWKPKTWDDIPKKVEETAAQVVEEKLSEKEKQEQDARKAEDAKQKQMDTFIDNQMADLEKNGVLPKIENPGDENDPGRAARRELLGFAGMLGTLDLSKASDVLKELHGAGKTYDPRANNMQGAFLRSNATPSGINAPVASSNRPVGNAPNKPDYKTLHNATMDTLIKMNMPDYS